MIDIVNSQLCRRCGRPLSAAASTSRGLGACCEAHEGHIHSPFLIGIDSNETQPYRFAGIKEDADRGHAIIIPRMVRKPMWRQGLADYTIDGLEYKIQLERKSLNDLYATLGKRRDEFEQEIARLNQWCDIAYLIIEAEWSEILLSPPPRSRLNPKTISRTHDSWSQKYPKVHWVTCAGRRHAEIKTYRLLEKYWQRWLQQQQSPAT